MITMHSILLALLSLAAAPQFEVQPLRGPPAAGRLVALDGKRLTIESAAGRSSWETSQLMGISAKEKPPRAEQEPQAWVDLVDGSTLLAQTFTVHNGRAQIVPGAARPSNCPSAALPPSASSRPRRPPPANGRGC